MINQAQTVFTNSSEETKRFGESFAKILKEKEIIALYGELGSGKTTFVQGLAKGLGIERRIISPTFIILRTYKIRVKNAIQNFKFFYHIDLYRIKNLRDIENLGIEEIMKSKKNIVVIEWAEKMKKMLPGKRWDIKFMHLKDDARRIKINKKNGHN